MPRPGVCPTLVMLLVAVFAVCSAQPIQEFVSDCDAMSSFFVLLEDRYISANKASTLSMTLTLDCTADWSGCNNPSMFVPTTPANSTKQPKVVINIRTNCKRGQSVAIPSASDTFAWITVDTSSTNCTSVVSVTGPLIINGIGVSHAATPGTKSTLAIKNVSVVVEEANVGISGDGLESMSVTGGLFSGVIVPILVGNVVSRVTISKATFDFYKLLGISLDLPANTKVSLLGNSFRNASSPINVAIFVTQAGGKMNIDMSKTTTDNSSSTPICINSPVNVAKPIVKVAGSVGITPNKANNTLMPAGWPTSGACNVAEFSAP